MASLSTTVTILDMADQQHGPPARPWYDVIMELIAVRGWGISELSQRAGVSRQTIYGWATNPRRPQAKSVNAVADALKVDRRRANILAGVIPAPEVPKDLEDSVRRTLPDEADQQRVLEAIARTLAGGQQPPNGPSGTTDRNHGDRPERRAV